MGSASISPIDRVNEDVEFDEEDADDEGIEGLPEGLEGERVKG